MTGVQTCALPIFELYEQDLEAYHAEIDNREAETIRRNEGQYGTVEVTPGFTRRTSNE